MPVFDVYRDRTERSDDARQAMEASVAKLRELKRGVHQAFIDNTDAYLSLFAAAWRGVPDCTASQCGNSRFHKPKPPYTVNLCPGACFGYFPTQWRSWNEVCPPEAGLVTGPVQPPIPPASKNGDGIPQPRPVDPKTEMTTPPPGMSPLPSIPPYPGPGRY